MFSRYVAWLNGFVYRFGIVKYRTVSVFVIIFQDDLEDWYISYFRSKNKCQRKLISIRLIQRHQWLSRSYIHNELTAVSL